MNKQNDSILLIERRGDTVCLTLNRPSVLNAINRELLLALKKELISIQTDPEVRAVILTGSGDKAFSAGADIGYLYQASPLEVRELARLAVSVNQCLESLNKITMALINGYALGGGLELAESCMLRLAVPSARFGHPEVKIGAVAGWGGTTRLPRLIGKARATELLLTGGMVDAEKALEYGLINRVTEPDTLRNEGEKLLEEVLANPAEAVNLTWQAIHRGLDASIDESARLGADFFGLVASTEEFRERTGAFLRRRKTRD